MKAHSTPSTPSGTSFSKVKNYVGLLFAVLLLLPAGLRAQNIVEIGEGTNSSWYPVPGLYGWQYSVYLYTPSMSEELANGGTITDLAYNFAAAVSTSGASLQIYMKDVDLTSLSSSTTFSSYTSGATQVYSNYSFTNTSGWNTFHLSTPFEHQPGKTLLIATRAVGCSTSGGCSRNVYYTNQTNCCWTKYQDSSDPGTSATASTVTTYLPNVQLTMRQTCANLVSPANGATVNSSSVTLSWESVAGATGYHIYMSGDETKPTTYSYSTTGTSQTVTNLPYGINYFWIVPCSGSTEMTGCNSYSTITRTCPGTIPAPTITSNANLNDLGCGQQVTLTADGEFASYFWYSDAGCTHKVGEGRNFSFTAADHPQTYYCRSGCAVSPGASGSRDFNYTGGQQSFTVPAGVSSVDLQVWGAQGGYRSSSTYGGKGGYAAGTLPTNGGEVLYIYVGGSGNTGGTSGGYNGGGSRSTYSGGGGATDIRLGGTSLYNRILVAGGGGSDGASDKQGMYGGGTTGGSSTESWGSGGQGGTQTGGGSGGSGNSGTFGQGGQGVYVSSGYGGGGGGGWYGGGGSYPDSSGDDDRGAGGGSGYVWTSGSTQVSGYLVSTAYYMSETSLIAGNESMPNPNGGTMTGREGNGFARITYDSPAVYTYSSPASITAGVAAVPPAPQVSVTGACPGEDVVMTVTNAQSGLTYGWWTNSSCSGAPVHEGTSYTIYGLDYNTTYYVRAYVGTLVPEIEFEYTGSEQSLLVPAGATLAEVEVYGAQGGYRSSSDYGGLGGYATGTIAVTPGETLYVNVGGSGNSGTISGTIYAGGYNGGGYRYGYPGGGGATHIATRSGVLKDLSDYRDDVIIVAGGGGSCGGSSYAGGAGGGANGVAATGGYGSYGYGGTQTGFTSTVTPLTSQPTTNSSSNYPGGFGFGGFGYYTSDGYGGAGGGGWYGGCGTTPDGSVDDDHGGGGGSGHLGSRVSNGSMSTGVRSGNGFARITFVGLEANCPSSITTVPVVFGTQPSFSISASSNTSCNGSPVTLTINNPQGGINRYEWSDGTTTTSTSHVVVPAQTTTYTVTAYNNYCTTENSITITVDAPMVQLVSTDNGCIAVGEEVVLNVEQGANALAVCPSSMNMSNQNQILSPGCSFNYYDPEGPNLSYVDNSSYIQTFTSASGAPITISFSSAGGESCCDFLRLYDGTSTSSPVLRDGLVYNVSGSYTANSGSLTVYFTSDVSNTGLGWAAVISTPLTNTYAWSTGDDTPEITVTPNETTTYTVTVSGSNYSCDAVLTHTVRVLPMVEVTPESPTVCPGGNVTLTASGADSYEWKIGNSLLSTNASYSATAGTYNVTGINDDGCSTTETVTVNSLQTPSAGSIVSADYCQSDYEITLASETNAVGGGNVDYRWNIGSITTAWSTEDASYTLTAADRATLGTGTFNVTRSYRDACGNTGSAQGTISINPPMTAPTVSGNRSLFCGQSTTLTASSNYTGENLHYRWYSDPRGENLVYEGAEFTTPSITENTTYYLQISNEYVEEGTPQNYTTYGAYTYQVPENVSSLKLEVWGAQGGYRSSSTYGGKGGYSVGTLTNLTPGQNLYVVVGGSGNTGSYSSSVYSGGYNGGGYRYDYYGGGGATHIATASGLLMDLSDNRDAVLIVAGGGGSEGASSRYGYWGGGETGGGGSTSTSEDTQFGTTFYGYTSDYVHCGQGGTQTSAGGGINAPSPYTTGLSTSTVSYTYGGFGFGGSGTFSSSGYGGAGGGGWYGGSGVVPDGSSDDDRGGGGGSGYVSSLLQNAQTIAGNTSFAAPGGGTETGHTGNGYARITPCYSIRDDCPSEMVPVTVTVNQMPAPQVAVNTACIGTPSEMTVTNPVDGYEYQWSTDPDFATIEYTGITFTPTVYASTQYYVRAAQAMAPITDFSYTGSSVNYTVPMGVSSIQVDLWGADGGNMTNYYIADGGRGGYTSAVFTVSGGETLQVNVGGRGNDETTANYTNNPGGWNGGGDAGYGTSYFTAASGGGASDVRRNGTALTDRILVAGGGGGAAYYCGGDAGGETGSTACTTYGSRYGYGATSNAGGSGGTGGANANGSSGLLGQGGAGGYGDAGGAGGGGGYYGGGGGASGSASAGGAGGGNGYVAPDAVGTTMSYQNAPANPDAEGNGFIRITLLDYSSNVCPSETATVTLTPVTAPSYTLTASTYNYCPGSETPVTLTATNPSADIISYTWSTGETTTANSIEVVPGHTQTYVVTATNGSCAYSQSVAITVDAPEVEILASETACINAGDEVTLEILGGVTSGTELHADDYTFTRTMGTYQNLANPTYLVNNSTTDGVSGTITFPSGFTFPYCGTTYDMVYVSDGQLRFGSSSQTYGNSDMLSNLSYYNILAPFLSDLYLTSGYGSLSYQLMTEGTEQVMTVQFKNATTYSDRDYSSSRAFNVQVKLYESGKISFCYGSGFPNINQYYSGAYTCIGINSENGHFIQITPTSGEPIVQTSGTLTALTTTNADYLTSGTIYTFTPSIPLAFQWSNGAETNSITVNPSETTTYTVTVSSDEFDCPAIHEYTVRVNPTVEVSATVMNVCLGEQSTLTATGADTYVWNTLATTNTITVSPTEATTYSVTGTTSYGCSNTAEIEIGMATYFDAGSIAGAGEACLSDLSVTIPSVQDGFGGGTVQYRWTSGTHSYYSNEPTYTLSHEELSELGEGSHTFVRYFKDECFHNDWQASTANPYVLTLNGAMNDPTIDGPLSVLCGESATLTATAASNSTHLRYLWYSDPECQNLVYEGREFETPNLNEDVTYYLKVTNEYLQEGTPVDYSTSGEYTYTIPANAAQLKLEVWGAQGGGRPFTSSTDAGYGGNGGYSVGTMPVFGGESLSVFVGGHGGTTDYSTGRGEGGWNGGGCTYTSSSADPANGGGGATDIRLNGTTVYDRIIVAGGGGGGGEDGEAGGVGGGESGTGTYAATQNTSGTGGIFGAAAHTGRDGGGAGGGWYGGGANQGSQTIPTSDINADNDGGSGGSGYVWTARTSSNAPAGYLVPASYYLSEASTIAGNSTFPAPTGGVETGHSGDGYARITPYTYIREECPSEVVPFTIQVNYMSAPLVEVRSACIGQPSELVVANAMDGLVYQWSTDPDFETIEYVGTTYTPTVTENTRYYVRSVTPVNETVDFEYTGSEQTYTVPVGVNQVRLEVWGAQGGDYNGYLNLYRHSVGGYSVGTLNVNPGDQLYINVGGAGTYAYASLAAGGYNGGGQAYSYNRYTNSGGGATDVRIGSNSLYSRVIVAGGGGGSRDAGSQECPTQSASAGGGVEGIGGSYYGSTTLGTGRAGRGGGATSPGATGTTENSETLYAAAFGTGGYTSTSSSYGVGGGGGWYGGGAGSADANGGGGSGYVYTSATASQYPAGCLLNSNHYLTDAQTIAGNVTFLSPSGEEEMGHAGNGYARISVASTSAGNCPSEVATVDLVPQVAPSFTLTSSSSTYCNGESEIVLTAENPVGDIVSYTWSTGETTTENSIEVAPGHTTTYSVTASTDYCWVAQSVTISVDAPEVEILASETACINAGDEVTLTCSGGGINGTVTIGSGTETTYYFPIDNFYNYSCTEQIFLPTEIGGAGTITSISMQYGYSNSFTASNVTMYMKNVSRSTFSSTSDYEPLSASDIVWTGTLSPAGAGWVTLNLNQPFNYDGTSNLLVAFYDGTSGYPGTSYVFNTTASPNSANMALAYKSDSDNPDPYDLGSYSGSMTLYPYRVNTKFNIVSSVEYAWSTGESTPGITVAPEETTTYTLTVTDGEHACPAILDYTVRVNPTVTITAEPQSLCQIDDDATLTASGAETYIWNNASLGAVHPVTGEGTYTVTATSVDGCAVSASYDLIAPVYNAGQIAGTTLEICQSELTPLTIRSIADGTTGGNIHYRWLRNGSVLPNTDTNEYTVYVTELSTLAVPGTYTYTRQVQNGCTGTWSASEGSVTLTINPPMAAPAVTYNDHVYCGTDGTLRITYPDPEKIYYWYEDAECTQLYATGPEVVVPAMSEDKTLWMVASAAQLEQHAYQFTYTGTVQEFVIPAGATSLTLQAWGAKGGGDNGGLGAYATGTLNNLDGIEKLYVYVGGAGQHDASTTGWNGGGNVNSFGGSGGGATDFALNGTTGSTTWNTPDHINTRLLVAGGGGGDGYSGTIGGYAGGTGSAGAGGAGTATGGYGATMSGPGSNNTVGLFGYASQSNTDNGGAGGGGWYGGASGTRSGTDAGAGGGSSYAWCLNYATYAPTAYRNAVSTDYYLSNVSLLGGNEYMPSLAGSQEYGHSGNGCAQIIATEYVNMGCSSLPVAYTLHVDAPAAPSVIAPQGICGMPVTMEVENPIDEYTYLWSTQPDFSDTVHFGTTYTVSAEAATYTYYVKSYVAQASSNSIDFEYTGDEQQFVVPAGVTSVNLEVWGAQGGDCIGSNSTIAEQGGKGGYSVGTMHVAPGDILYVYVGGQGASNITGGTGNGGFNGGGYGCSTYTNGGTSYTAGSGGGATDIRLNSNSLYARAIVAGGGGGTANGGSTAGRYAGVGGGEAGGNVSLSYSYSGSFLYPTGGTQTAPGTYGYFGSGSDYASTSYNGAFGEGGSPVGAASASSTAFGGGGGGWYGGGACAWGPGGGGSGYVYSSATAFAYPSECLLNSSYYLEDAQTIAGNLTITEPDGTTATGHSGNGYARISYEGSAENLCESNPATVTLVITDVPAPTFANNEITVTCADEVLAELSDVNDNLLYVWYSDPTCTQVLSENNTDYYMGMVGESTTLYVRAYTVDEFETPICSSAVATLQINVTPLQTPEFSSDEITPTCGTPLTLTFSPIVSDYTYVWYADEDLTRQIHEGTYMEVAGRNNLTDTSYYVVGYRGEIASEESQSTTYVCATTPAIITIHPNAIAYPSYAASVNEDVTDELYYFCEGAPVYLYGETSADYFDEEAEEPMLVWYDENHNLVGTSMPYETFVLTPDMYQEAGSYTYFAYAGTDVLALAGTFNLTSPTTDIVGDGASDAISGDIFFDVVADVDLTIDTISFYAGEAGSTATKIYARSGSYADGDAVENPGMWTLNTNQTSMTTAGGLCKVALTTPLDLEAGERYAFYICNTTQLYTQQYGSGYTQGIVTGSTIASGNVLSVKAGWAGGRDGYDFNYRGLSNWMFKGSIGYHVDGETRFGCLSNDYVEVAFNVNVPPTVEGMVLDVPVVACEGYDIRLFADGGDAGDFAKYAWSTGTCDNTPFEESANSSEVYVNATQTETYFVKFTDVYCPSTECISATVHVVNNVAVGDITAPDHICATGSLVIDRPSYIVNDGEDYEYSKTGSGWQCSQDGETWIEFTDSTHIGSQYNGWYVRYYVEIENCKTGYSNVVKLAVDSLPVVTNLVQPDPFCSTRTFDWVSNAPTVEMNNNSGYAAVEGWDYTINGQEVEFDPTRTFTFEDAVRAWYYATNACGTVYTDTIDMLFIQPPTVENITALEGAVCAGQPLALVPPTVHTYGGTINQGWEYALGYGSTNFIPLPEDAIIDYSMNQAVVRYYIGNECTIEPATSNFVQLFVNDVPRVGEILSNGTTYCSGAEFDIAAPEVLDNGGIPETGFGWYLSVDSSFASTSELMAVNVAEGIDADLWNGMWLRYADSNACGVGFSNAVPVAVYPSFHLTVTPEEQDACLGNTFTLEASSDNANATYSWTGNGLLNTTGTQVSATPNALGQQQYVVTASETEHGCSATATATLNVFLLTKDTNVHICASDLDYVFDEVNYPDVVCTQSGHYTYRYTTANGCDSLVNLNLTVTYPIERPSRVHYCNYAPAYVWPVTGEALGGPTMRDTVITREYVIPCTVDNSDIDHHLCDSIIYSLVFEISNEPYLDVPVTDITLPVNQSASASFNIRKDCDFPGAKMAIKYNFYKDDQLIDVMQDYGQVYISTYTPIVNENFGNTVRIGSGEVPGNTYSMYYYDFDYFFANYFCTIDNQVTASWNVPGEYRMEMVVIRKATNSGMNYAYQTDDHELMGGAGGISTDSIFSDTVNIYFHVGGVDTLPTQNVVVCAADLPYYVGSLEINETGYYEAFTGNEGQFQLQPVNVTVQTSAVNTFEVVLNSNCASYEWNGETYSAPGTYYDTIRYAESGCDSLVTVLNLSYHSGDVVIDTTVVACGSFLWNVTGETYTESADIIAYGTYGECDAQYNLHLTVKEVYEENQSIVLAVTQLPYDYDADHQIDAEGTYSFVYTRTNGCDSIIHLTVDVEGVIIDIDTTLFASDVPAENQFDININAGSLDNRKVIVEYEVTRNGEVIDNMSEFGYVYMSTDYPDMNRAFGREIHSGLGNIPANTFTIINYDYRYFYLDFLQATTSHLVANWNMAGDYKVKFTVLECEGGMDYVLRSNLTGNIIGGGGSISTTNVLAVDSVVMHYEVDTVFVRDSIVICSNELPYEFHGLIFTESTTENQRVEFTDRYHVYDTVSTFSLTVNPAYYIYDTAYICAGQSYADANFDLSADTIRQMAQSGKAEFTMNPGTAMGCDSVVTLTLFIHDLPNTTVTSHATSICENSAYPVPIEASGAQYYSWIPDSLDLQGSTTVSMFVPESMYVYLTGTNEYVTPMGTINCSKTDSVYFTVLPQGGTTDYYAEVCQGQPYDDELFHVEAAKTQVAGVVDTTIMTGTGFCGNYYAHLILTVNPTYNAQYGYVDVIDEVCEGYEYHGNGFDLTVDEIEEQRHISDVNVFNEVDFFLEGVTAHGCDSVTRLTLFVNPTHYGQGTVHFCTPDAWPYVYTENGQDFEVNGDTTVAVAYSQAVNGCDSVHYTTVIFDPMPQITILNTEVCANVDETNLEVVVTDVVVDSLKWFFGTDVMGTDNMMNVDRDDFEGDWSISVYAGACVMTEDVAISNIPLVEITIDTAVCEGGVYVSPDETYDATGEYDWYVPTDAGCDIHYVLNLTVNPTYATSDSRTIRAVELPYTWNGVVFEEAGIQTVYLTSVSGCDSIVEMTLDLIDTLNGQPFMVIAPASDNSFTLTTFANSEDLSKKVSIDYTLYKKNAEDQWVAVQTVEHDCGGTLNITTELNGSYMGRNVGNGTGNIPANTFIAGTNYYDYFYFYFLNTRENLITHDFTVPGEYQIVFDLVEETGGYDMALSYTDHGLTRIIGGKNSVEGAALAAPVVYTFTVAAPQGGGDSDEGTAALYLSQETVETQISTVNLAASASGFEATDKFSIDFTIYRDDVPVSVLTNVAEINMSTWLPSSNSFIGKRVGVSTGSIPGTTFRPTSNYTYNYFYTNFLNNTYNQIQAKWLQTGNYSIEFNLVSMEGGLDLPLTWNGAERIGGKNAVSTGTVLATATVEYNVTSISAAPTGIAVMDEDGWSIYPNPARDMVDVYFPNMDAQTDITVTDMNGKIVTTVANDGTQHAAVNVSTWAAGIYFVNVRTNDTVVTKKLVVTK